MDSSSSKKKSDPYWRRQSQINSFSGEFEFLSNFHQCRIELDGTYYPSVEHAYQASKTLQPSERVIFQEKRNLKPGDAKRRGRKVTLRSGWENIKIPIMVDLLRQKFSDPVLAKKLDDTGKAHLIEGNWWRDKFWGVYKGEGENWLGKLLMDVREEVRRGKSEV